MTSEFKIEIVDWLPSDDGAGELRLTGAEIRIEINGIVATEVEDCRSQSVRRSVRVSAGLFAQWLLYNWWRLRWEPEREFAGSALDRADWIASHSLPGIGYGFVWPLLTFSSDGSRVGISLAKSLGAVDLSPIRYLNSFFSSISAKAFEIAVDEFVAKVLSRMDSTGFRDSALHRLHDEIRLERLHRRTASTRKLEALLGIDPNQDTVLVKGLISKWSKKIGRRALDEIAAAQPGASSIESSLLLAEAAATHSNHFANLSEMQSLKTKIDIGDPFSESAPWVAAKRAASDVRKAQELGDRTIGDKTLAAILQTTEGAFKTISQSAPFPLMARVDKSERYAIVLGGRHEQNRRFAIARFIADALIDDSNGGWRPATKGNTSRQKFQRAFAAEFLCPSDIVMERASQPMGLDSIDDLTIDLASEYGVSQWVVSTHLVNRGLAPPAILSISAH